MKKAYILLVATIFFLMGNPQSGRAEGNDFPSRPLEVVVPFPPGGTADIATRIVMDQLSKEINSPVTVVNKPGASGSIGAAWVAKSKADGYMFLTGNAACLIMPYFFLKTVAYETNRDFTPLAYVGESPSILAVQSSSPLKTFDEMLDYAKKNPGKLSYATSAGLSSVSTMNMEVVRTQAGIDITRVVYQGGGPALTAILGGHVDIIATSIPALGSQIEAGKVRVLVSTKKIDDMPEVPTLTEKGFPAVVNWTGFFAPSKIPSAARDKLVAAFDKALQHPGVMKKLKDAGYFPERKTPAEITGLLKEQSEVVEKIVKATKIKK